METLIDEEGATVVVHRGWVPEEERAALFEEFRAAADRQFEVRMGGRAVLQPRLQHAYGSRISDSRASGGGASRGGAAGTHSYSGAEVPMDPWPETLAAVRDRIRDEHGVGTNSCLVNHYRDGRDYIGWHSDTGLRGQRGRGAPEDTAVVTVSLGTSRRFLLRRKDGTAIPETSCFRVETVVDDGDMVLMLGRCQELYQHSVPKQLRVREPRVSLTFRDLKGAPPP